jgi:pSer/pThr/pTyr-binding forkhead associated (FHA) protein
VRSAKITLTVVRGDRPEKKYVFKRPTRCIIGRAPDCDIQLSAHFQHAVVSRHHCCLEIEPPSIRVHDLGSRNGTYVNGGNIGQRSSHLSPEEVDLRAFAARELKNGDQLEVGNTVFRVGIEVSRDLVLPTERVEVPSE